jgi:outer membrane receptor protein involved in Fe transport
MRRDSSKRHVRCSAAGAAIIAVLAVSVEAWAQDNPVRPAAPADPLGLRDTRTRHLGLGEPDVVIDGAELRSYGTSFYEVEEPLALRAGIGFHATGDTASEDWVLIRGWPRDSSRNVLVLLDGMPINNAAYEGVEFHDLPTTLLQRAEVYKPPLPARYGGCHAVINFVSRAPAHAYGVSGRFAIGSFDTQRGDVGATTGYGPLWSTLDLGFLSTDNLTGQLRTPPVDTLRYEDRSYWDVAPTLLATYDFNSNTRLRLISLYSRGKKAFSDDEYRNRWFSSTNLTLEHHVPDSAVLRLNSFVSFEHYFLRLHMHPDVSRQDRVKLGSRASAEIRLPFHNLLLIGGDVTRNTLDQPSGLHDFHNWGLFVEDHFTPLRWLGLSAGVRYDGSEVDAVEINPSAALNVSPWTGGVVFGRWSRSTRWPSLGEVPAGGGVEGERLHGFSSGVRQRLLDNRLTLAATGFYLWLEGELVTDPTSSQYVNDSVSSVSRGAELEAAAQVARGLHLFGSYTSDQLRRGGSSEPIAYGPPRHSAAAGLFFHDGPYTARLSGRYIGKKRGVYSHMGRSTTVADSLVVDLYGALDVERGLAAFANVGNLFNLRYETFQGRPMMPRTVLLGLEMRAP